MSAQKEQEESVDAENHHADEKERESDNASEDAVQGDGLRARSAFAGGHPFEQYGRDDVRHHHDGQHADDSHFCQGTHGWMFGENQNSDADEHDGGGEDDGILEL